MAKFVVDDYIDIGTGGPLGATSWRVFKDKEKTNKSNLFESSPPNSSSPVLLILLLL